MNAGAYGACMADVLESVRVYKPARMLDDGTRGSGSIIEFDVDELNLGYRKSRIADDGFAPCFRPPSISPRATPR